MTATKTQAILVLGMHRSGTSALTRVLNLSGADVGPNLLAAGPDNPGGFWEPAAIVDLHERLLAAIGRTWHDPRPIPAGRLLAEDLAPFRHELRAILARDFGGADRFVIKDPRLCRLVPFWRPVLDDLGMETHSVIAWRNPAEVAGSLQRRNQMSEGVAHLLWLEHNLAAERDTRGTSRVVVSYDALLADWRAALATIESGLGLESLRPAPEAAAEIDGFLDPALRHHAGTTGPLPRWVRTLTRALDAPRPDVVAFKEVAAQYEETGELFFPWADAVAEELTHEREIARDRSHRLARLRQQVRGMKEQTDEAVEAASSSPAAAAPAASVPAPANAPVATGASAASLAGSPLHSLLTQDGTTIVRDVESFEGDPRVSIVIPIYGQLDLTVKCVESLAEFTGDVEFEIVFVDNGTTDGTQEFLSCLDGNVRVVRNEKNLGFATACNQGAALAGTDTVLFLNNDIEATQSWLEPLLSHFEDPDVGVTGAKLLFPNGEVQHAGVALLSRPGGVPLGAFHLFYGCEADHPGVVVRREVPVVTGACLAIRRDLFFAVGGFDMFFWNGCEDIDLCLKVGELGRKIVYEPESVLIHHESMAGEERFTRTGSNERLLASRWAGRVPVDYEQREDGDRIETGTGRIRPYERRSETSLETGTAGDAPAASIVILTRNQLEHTVRCLESIERHTPEPHEIVIVDNGSTDGSVDWLKEWAEGRPNARLLLNHRNAGFGAGCNVGMAASRGTDFVLLNNDTVVTEGWLGRQLDRLADDPNVGIVGPMTNRASGPQVVADVPYRDLEGMQRFASAWAHQHAGQTMEAQRMPAFCWVVRREVVDAIGGFDERFGAGNFEDDDFCLRAAQVGWRSQIARDVFIHHVGSQTFAGERIDYAASMERNFRIFAEKWGITNPPSPPSYVFATLAGGARMPRIELPRIESSYESSAKGVLEEKRRASAAGSESPWEGASPGSSEATAESAPASGQHRLHVGVLEDEPNEAVQDLFARYGSPNVPVFRTAADLAAACRRGDVLLLRGGVHLLEDALQELVHVSRAATTAGGVVPTTNVGSGAERVAGTYHNLKGDLARFVTKRRRRHRGKATAAEAVAGASCVLLRHDALANVELPSEGPAGEAAEALVARLQDAGWPLLVARGAHVHVEDLTPAGR